jgi:transcriptional regulator with XRE-family HTH domain
MRLDLKIAILKSGKTQRRLALDCRIPENRLSAIVCDRETPTDEELTALTRELGQPADQLGFARAAVA